MASNKILKRIKYVLRAIPDKAYIQIYYFLRFKKICNLNNPQTFNEKLNWLKLNDRDPLYTRIVDKYEAKNYISEIIGEEYIIPTLGVWDNFDDIDFSQLPTQFVLKCTHDSEGIVIVTDKSSLDIDMARKKITAALRQNFYYIAREWPYKNVKPKIIAEQYMEDYVDGELRDYKFFCFDGVPKAMYIASGRNKGNTKFDFFDLDFKHLDITQKYPNSLSQLRKPDTFDQMIKLSRKLSEGFSHVRVDFYEVNGNLYVGELTFYHLSGMVPFKPAKWDKIFGDWLKIP